MDNSTLYIIGNGFDLQHNLKSSYDEYHRYVKNNRSNVEDFLNQYFTLKVKKDKKVIIIGGQISRMILQVFMQSHFFMTMITF